MYIKSILGTVAALTLATAAQAQIAVSIWTNQPGPGSNATVANAPGVAPDATTTVGPINFDSRVTGYTIGQFLNGPALPSGVATATMNNTYMLFTGQIALDAGANVFQITHDDGLQLIIDGIGTVVNQPTPTSPVTTNFTANAPLAGLYNFHLSYGEVQGPPAVLTWNFRGVPFSGDVPEPATWAMMLVGFGGIGMAMRRQRRNRQIAQLA